MRRRIIGGAIAAALTAALVMGAGTANPGPEAAPALLNMGVPPGVPPGSLLGGRVDLSRDGTGRSPVPPTALQEQEAPEWHEFYFTRAAYSSGGGFGRGGRRRASWSTDYPKADRQFLTVLKRLTNLDAYEGEHAILLTNPGLRRFPFLYALEVGSMNMGPGEIAGLRDYLEAGGFLVIDDFWGTREWIQFEYQMSLVFPNRSIIDLDLDHPVFSTYYEIDEILQVPAYGRFQYGGTSESDGYIPYVKGIEDDDGRLMVMINWNTDLGDAWEWAERPDYPLQFSTFAYQMGVNMIVYAMSH